MIGEWLLGAERDAAPFNAGTLFRVSSPFNDLHGAGMWNTQVVEPLLEAIRGAEWCTAMELRSAPVDGKWQVASWGTLVGVFQQPWCGIDPTGDSVAVRVGAIVDFVSDDPVRCTVMIDVLDLAEQAGQPFTRQALGTPGLWPLPRTTLGNVDGAAGDQDLTITVVKAMQSALHDSARTRDEMLVAPHLGYWHDDFVWAGPGGIGTTVGVGGFVDFHQLPFRSAFPDRVGGGALSSAGTANATGHFVKFAQGNFAVTGGWPSVVATHVGDGWLGEPATGLRITLRVFDFYELTGAKISMNWVFIDLLDFLAQIGKLPQRVADQRSLTKGMSR